MEKLTCGKCKHFIPSMNRCMLKDDWVVVTPTATYAENCKYFEPREEAKKPEKSGGKTGNPSLILEPPKPLVEVVEFKTASTETLEGIDVESLEPVERVEYETGSILFELRREKGFRKPFLQITLFDATDTVLDTVTLPYDRIEKIMQPRFITFRTQLKKIIGKKKISEFLAEIKSRILPTLMQRFEKYRQMQRIERERKRRELYEKYKEDLEEIAKDPVKHIMEVVNFYHIGDEEAKRMLIPVLASRFLPRNYRLSVVVSGPSSLGKNNLVKAFMKCTPRSWWNTLTRMTPRALDYLLPEGGSIDRVILYFMEYEGLNQAKYSVRISISEGEISVAYVARNEKTGEMETRIRKLKGTPLIITTTTAVQLDQDIETRTFYIEPDPSEEQTKRIREFYITLESSLELKEKELEIKEKAKKIRLFFRLLKPYDVIIPREYLERLLGDLPLVVRARRDDKKLIAAVKALAVLNQFKRKRVKDSHGREFLVADIEDIEYVEKWLKGPLRKQMLEIREIHERILVACPLEGTFTAREIAEKVKVSYRHTKRVLDDLVEKGFLIVDTKTKPYKYAVKMNSAIGLESFVKVNRGGD